MVASIARLLALAVAVVAGLLRLWHRAVLLAPAGDEECMKAAVGAGADAVYFGLATGFNARAKAANVALDSLAKTFDYLHAHTSFTGVTLATGTEPFSGPLF